jgi:hypothetical protein
MKIIKKFTAIQIRTQSVDDNVKIKLEYGQIKGPYYSRESPDEEFDTEDEAIEYAYKSEPYCRWLILPIIKFNDF